MVDSVPLGIVAVSPPQGSIRNSQTYTQQMYMKADEIAATACYLKNESRVIKMNNPYSDPNDNNDETNFTGIRRR